MRKQEVRVDPPVVQTDTGSDTEVKMSCISNDILVPISINNHRSSDLNNSNVSLASVDYNTADSGEFYSKEIYSIDYKSKEEENNDNECSNTNFNSLFRSATVDSLNNTKKKAFGKEFIPKVKLPEPSPLLIIKRTPSKINLPSEPGKPKVVIKPNAEVVKKYFGDTTVKSRPPKPIMKPTSKKEVKQPSPEKKKTPPLDRRVSFSFEPEESDIKELDNYIENLIANEAELLNPSKPKTPEVSSSLESICSSLDDLLKALEMETNTNDEVETDEKITDLLDWMDDLQYQEGSMGDTKYKKLEESLKKPQRTESLVSKIPRNSITFFERQFLGKRVENYGLSRSKTDVYCNQKHRSSVDLDAVSKVDVKKVLQKFENGTCEPTKIQKRQSLGNIDFKAPHNESKNLQLNSAKLVTAANVQLQDRQPISENQTKKEGTTVDDEKMILKCLDTIQSSINNILLEPNKYYNYDSSDDNSEDKNGTFSGAPIVLSESESESESETDSNDKSHSSEGGNFFAENNIKLEPNYEENNLGTAQKLAKEDNFKIEQDFGLVNEDYLMLPQNQNKSKSILPKENGSKIEVGYLLKPGSTTIAEKDSNGENNNLRTDNFTRRNSDTKIDTAKTSSTLATINQSEIKLNKDFNVEDLYAKVIKPKRPVRQKLNEPPLLPPRKKSLDMLQPVPPPRKKTASVSPSPQRKTYGNSNDEHMLPLYREKVITYELPKTERVVMNTNGHDGNSLKHDSKNKNDCCIS